MTATQRSAVETAEERDAARRARPGPRWAGAVVRASRPRQWPKNLLVLAAPIAGATLGHPDSPAYALIALAAAMAASYALWALTVSHGPIPPWWHLASIVPLVIALGRFDLLTGHAGGRPVEDLIIRDRVMAAAELAWLVLFALGMITGM